MSEKDIEYLNCVKLAKVNVDIMLNGRQVMIITNSLIDSIDSNHEGACRTCQLSLFTELLPVFKLFLNKVIERADG